MPRSASISSSPTLENASLPSESKHPYDLAEKGHGNGGDSIRGRHDLETPSDFTQATGLRAPPSNEPPAALVEKEECNDPVFADEKQWEVSWEEGEEENPMNWSPFRKWSITAVGGILVLYASFASSAPGGVIPQMARVFGMSSIEGTLVISIFVGGYVVGPLLWGPLSESYGRRLLFIISFALCTLLQIGSALAPNTAAVLIFRFLGGMTASCPLTNAGAILGDMFDANTRGAAVALFVICPFAGPALGPIVGGFMAVAGLKWYWLFWVLCVFCSICLLLIVFSLPETYSPVLLAKKAKRLRKKTGDDRWFAPLERQQSGLKARAHDVCVKPFVMLIEEPMLLCITLYMSFLYGLLYLCFVAYPIIFQQGHGMNAGISGLMFLPLFIGSCIAAIYSVLVINPRYIQSSAEYPPYGAPPELRLESAMIGAVALPISMFWLAWTSYSSVHWIAPCLSGLLLGIGLILVFLSLFNYIIDTYLMKAGTALASTTVIRSLFGFGFPLFASTMYQTLNPRIAGSILGAIAVLFMPIPFFLLKYGARIRGLSKNAVPR